MKSSLLALSVLLGLGFAAPAWAHAHLDSASPAQGAVLTASPEAVTLAFTENLELALSRLTVADAVGKPVAASALEHEAGDVRTLRVALPKLAPGVYKVEWRAASVDTHSTEGAFTFTLN